MSIQLGLKQKEFFKLDESENVWVNFEKPDRSTSASTSSDERIIAYKYSIRINQNIISTPEPGISRRPTDIDIDEDDLTSSSPGDIDDDDVQQPTRPISRAASSRYSTQKDAPEPFDEFDVVSREKLWELLQKDVDGRLYDFEGQLRVVEFESCSSDNVKELVNILGKEKSKQKSDKLKDLDFLTSFLDTPSPDQNFYIGKQLRGFFPDFSIIYVSLPILSLRNPKPENVTLGDFEEPKFELSDPKNTGFKDKIGEIFVQKAWFLAISNETVAILRDDDWRQGPATLPGQGRQGAIHFLAQAMTGVLRESDDAVIKKFDAHFQELRRRLDKRALAIAKDKACGADTSAVDYFKEAFRAMDNYQDSVQYIEKLISVVSQQSSIIGSLHDFLGHTCFEAQVDRRTADGRAVKVPVISDLDEQMPYTLPILKNEKKHRSELVERLMQFQNSARPAYERLMAQIEKPTTKENDIIVAIENLRDNQTKLHDLMFDARKADTKTSYKAIVKAIEDMSGGDSDSLIAKLNALFTNLQVSNGTNNDAAISEFKNIIIALNGKNSQSKSVVTAIDELALKIGNQTSAGVGAGASAGAGVSASAGANVAATSGSTGPAQIDEESLKMLVKELLEATKENKVELESQGELFSFFTVITTIFLPLSFFAAYYALPFGLDSEDKPAPITTSQSRFWKYSGPFCGAFLVFITLLVIFKKEYAAKEILKTVFWDCPRYVLSFGRYGMWRAPKTRREKWDEVKAWKKEMSEDQGLEAIRREKLEREEEERRVMFAHKRSMLERKERVKENKRIVKDKRKVEKEEKKANRLEKSERRSEYRHNSGKSWWARFLMFLTRQNPPQLPQHNPTVPTRAAPPPKQPQHLQYNPAPAGAAPPNTLTAGQNSSSRTPLFVGKTTTNTVTGQVATGQATTGQAATGQANQTSP